MQRKSLFLAIPVFLAIAAAFVAFLGYTTALVPLEKTGDAIEIIVEPGASVREIARELADSAIVPSAKGLLLWIRFKGIGSRIQAGKHSFLRYEGALKAAEKLLDAEDINVKITVPEGLVIEQTAALLADTFDFDVKEFVDLCNRQRFIDSLGIRATTLEGYLFPETYRLPPNAEPKEIISRMVACFRERVGSLPRSAMHDKYTMHEIVTMASIVEKEATLASERSHIAGVFYNRLEKGWPLGADPTVRYALRKFSGPLRVSELQNTSPYNTRLHAGLPPGPICSPGFGALKAAVDPLETLDMYFVAKWDGSGAHDFSRTNREHDRKKMEIRRENERRKQELANSEKGDL
jgi:UPF0755 protein